MDSELVLSCVMPYIQQDIDLLGSVSLVSKNYYEIDSLTRKHLTVHVVFAPDLERVSRRFPNIESLTLKCYSDVFGFKERCTISVAPWIQEIAVKFESLKSLSIRNMVVSPSDLKLLANTGPTLRSLDMRFCKMFSEDGLVDIARDCTKLTSLRLYDNDIDGRANGKWLHELALHNTVMESLDFGYPFDCCNIEDLTLLSKNCSNSLVSLIYDTSSHRYDTSSHTLIDFKQVFKHAKKLDHFGIGIIDVQEDYSGFEFPPNICGLRFKVLNRAQSPFVPPYLHQLRELVLNSKCEYYFFKSCPNLEVLEVLHTGDRCEDIGLQLIGQFCKKLRKLKHRGWVTNSGLKAVAQGCPALEYLDVCIDISNETLECVGTHLKNLRLFHIHCEDYTDSPLDNGVRAMLMGCNKLERLDFSVSIARLTDLGLGIIGEYGHNLRSLSLSRAGESDVGLLELAKGCPKLRKLELHRCPFSEEAIRTLVFNLNQSLRYVKYEIGYDDNAVCTRPIGCMH